MPPIEEFDTRQTYAVLWEYQGPDKNNEPILAQPVQVTCRWVDTHRSGVDEKGTPLTITAEVATTWVIPTRSVMWKGKLSDWDDTGRQDLKEVVGRDYAPSVDAKFDRWEYELARFRGKLPARVVEV